MLTKQKSKEQLYIASIALLVANFGSSIFSFAMGLFLLRQYSSASIFGISQAIGPIVSLVIAPILRLVIDKISKKTNNTFFSNIKHFWAYIFCFFYCLF